VVRYILISVVAFLLGFVLAVVIYGPCGKSLADWLIPAVDIAGIPG
jgi:hypothetical protein